MQKIVFEKYVMDKPVKINHSGIWYYGEEYIIKNVDYSRNIVIAESYNNIEEFNFDLFQELYDSYFEFDLLK